MLSPADKLRIDNDNHCMALRGQMNAVSREISMLEQHAGDIDREIASISARKLNERNLETRRKLELELVKLRNMRPRVIRELNIAEEKFQSLKNDFDSRSC